MTVTAESPSLFEIDAELDSLIEEMQEQNQSGEEIAGDLKDRFHAFCAAHGEKVDRIGRFVRVMEAREQFCRSEANRLMDRARIAANKVERTKSMVLYYLLSKGIPKVEGREFTLRAQKNGQDSVKILDDLALPLGYRRIEARIDGVLWETIVSYLPAGLVGTLEGCVVESKPNAEAIKAAVARQECVPGAEVRRGSHLRVA